MSDSSVAAAARSVAPCAAEEPPAQYTPAEQFMRKVLFIRDKSTNESEGQRLFSASILVSATRCLLAYVVFPLFAPALYAASSWGPAIGLTVGVVALVFDIASIRRFWASNHRLRWHMTVIYVCVIGLVIGLLANDITRLLQ